MNYVASIHPGKEGRNRILDDLLDLLWTEDIAGLQTRTLCARQDDSATITLGKTEVVIYLEADRWRGGSRPVRIEYAGTGKSLDPSDLLWVVLNTLPELDLQILDRTMRQLNESERNADLVGALGAVLANAGRQEGALENALLWERMAAWQDRPFHPLAHSRRAWETAEIEQYGAEFGRFFPLRWCAVEHTSILASPHAKEGGPAAKILNDVQSDALQQEVKRRGIGATHQAMPLHPWQAEHVLVREYSEELAGGQIVMLDFRGPLVAATSSLRTVVAPSNPARHIKLPLDVETLGVRRLLSAQSLHNGLKGADLLSAAIARRPELGRVARLVDESQFWTFSEPSGDILAPKTASLGCLIRDFPLDNGASVMPLAALAVVPVDGIPTAMAAALKANLGSTVEGFLTTLIDLLAGFTVEALACGFIPEMHGQNVLVEISAGLPTGIILRDHDTVRCVPAVLTDKGLKTPDYVIKDPRRATMLLSQPEDLFAYGQTLLFDVALRAICVELDRAGAIGLSTSRRLLRSSVEHHVGRIDMPSELRARLKSALLDQPEWPFKQILTPLLQTAELGLGMPSRLGLAGNPLRYRE